MSWYSDGDPFDEYDPPWCNGCEGGSTIDECRKCCDAHIEEIEASKWPEEE